MISVLKENSVASFIESIQFDRNNEINSGSESYSIYQNKKAKLHIVEYCDPETGQLHKGISKSCLFTAIAASAPYSTPHVALVHYGFPCGASLLSYKNSNF